MSHVINLDFINETYMKINSNSNRALKLIHAHFQFEVPNARFHPLVKKKIWDGKIKLFNWETKLIYRGLIDQLEEFCDKHEIILEKPDLNKNELTFDEFDEWVKNDLMPVDDEGNSLNPYDYQRNTIVNLFNEKRNLLLSPTNSGKSFIIYALMMLLIHHQKIKGKMVIIVPTTNLVNQMYGDFKDYSQKNGFDVEQYVHKIYSGEDKETDKPIIITTWQSAKNMSPEWFEDIHFVVGDEAHEYTAKETSKIFESMINCEYRYGMTGTIDDTKMHFLVLTGLFGNLIRSTTTKKMITSGQSTKLEVKCYQLVYTSTEKAKEFSNKVKEEKQKRKKNNKALNSYQIEIDMLENDEDRNEFIRKLALTREGGNTLILFNTTKHGELIYNKLKEKNTTKKKIELIHGKIDKTYRQKIIDRAKKEDNMILVCSYGTFKRGISIKRLFHLILASPTKAPVTIIQSLGRMLRLFNGKNVAYIYDLSDDLLPKRKEKNPTYKHFLKRLKIYKSEGHPYKIKKIKIG